MMACTSMPLRMLPFYRQPRCKEGRRADTGEIGVGNLISQAVPSVQKQPRLLSIIHHSSLRTCPSPSSSIVNSPSTTYSSL